MKLEKRNMLKLKLCSKFDDQISSAFYFWLYTFYII